MNKKIIEQIFKEEVNNIIEEKMIESIISDEIHKMGLNESSERMLESILLEKKGKKKKNKTFVRQVQEMLKDKKLDLAAIAKNVYPKMKDDTRRSYISKQKRGKRPISHNQATLMYNAMSNRRKS